MSSDTESRFAHLLQPIRALADNWNIDIARELEDYLGELEKITFSFDGVSNSLNFAEAALVIQGSAVVYSKKVEYLYALLYQTLDFLVERKQRKAQQDATAESNEVETEPDFLSLDDDLEEGKGIDLVEGESPVRPPRTSSTRISMSLAMASDVTEPTNEENGDNGGVAKKKDKFQLNSCFVHSSGALVFDSLSLQDDPMLSSNVHATPFKPSRVSIIAPNMSTIMEDNPTLNTTNSFADQQQQETSGSADIHMGGFDLGAGAGDDDDDDNEAVPRDGDDEGDDEPRTSIFGQFAAEQSEKAKTAGGGVKVRATGGEGGRRERPKKRVVDLWAMLDPHEEVGTTKPLKKGKSYRIRTAPKPKQEDDAVVPILSIAETPHVFKGVRGPDFTEFAYLYSMELKRRKEAKKRDKFEFTFEDTVFAGAEEEEEEEELHYHHETSTLFNGATEDIPVEPEMGMDAGANDDDDDDDIDIGDVGILDQDESGTQTYEDFYASRVEQFMSEAAQYAQESNLSKRVNDWKSKLAPVLEEQESHPAFDIQSYGETLIYTLKDEYEGKEGVHIDEEGDVQTEDDLIIPFAKLTVGVEKYEVARRFTAMLQLVNNANVSVVTTKEVDSLGFHLLSVKPKFDIENYRAPSLDPSLPPPPLSSLPAGAKKGDEDKLTKKATTTTKGKRGRPAKNKTKDDEEVEKPSKKGSKKAVAEKEEEEEEEEGEKEEESEGEEKGKGKGKGKTKPDDKENKLNGREKRKRKERTFFEPDEEVLKGPRTKMFEVKV